MAKKRITSPDESFSAMFGTGQGKPIEEEKPAAEEPPAKAPDAAIVIEGQKQLAVEPAQSAASAIAEGPAKPLAEGAAPKASEASLVRATFYINKSQHKKMKLRAALSDGIEDKDLSAIVRAALDLYMKEW